MYSYSKTYLLIDYLWDVKMMLRMILLLLSLNGKMDILMGQLLKQKVPASSI